MEVLHSDEGVEPAAEAVQCQVCQQYVEMAWQVREPLKPALHPYSFCPYALISLRNVKNPTIQLTR